MGEERAGEMRESREDFFPNCPIFPISSTS